MQRFKCGLVLACATFGVTVAGISQAGAWQADDAVAAAQNQLGIVEYCQAQGYIDGKAVEIQKRLSTMMPPVTDAAKVAEAYAKGQQGTLSALGNETTLAQAASSESLTEQGLCQKIAAALEQVGAQMPK